MRNGMLVFVLSALALVGVAQTTPTLPPVTPIPPITIVIPIPIPLGPLCLDLSQATFSQPPGASEGIGAWFIPVQGLSGILNAPPSRDTAIGIMIVGPEVAILDFRVDGGIAFLISAHWKKERVYSVEGGISFLISEHWKKERIYSREVRWVPMGPGVAGEIRFDFVYGPILPPPDPLWLRPAGIKFEHKLDDTWVITPTW